MFAALNPTLVEHCFTAWMRGRCPRLAGCHVAIDGRTVRGSCDGGQAPLHVVSAWCSANGLVLGQVATEHKSNDITAISALLHVLPLQGATVKIDAIGTQHTIAETIVAYVLAACRTWGLESENQPQRGQFLTDLQAHSSAMGQNDGEKWGVAADLQPTTPKSDRLLAVKDKQPTLADAIHDWFAAAQSGAVEHSYREHVEYDKGHGRLEIRICPVKEGVVWLPRLAMVESHRTVNGQPSIECRYVISSRA